MGAIKIVPPQLTRDLHATLARLRAARSVDPKHRVLTSTTPDATCTSEGRLHTLVEQAGKAAARRPWSGTVLRSYHCAHVLTAERSNLLGEQEDVWYLVSAVAKDRAQCAAV